MFVQGFGWCMAPARLEVETGSDLTPGVVAADVQVTSHSPLPNAPIAIGVRADNALEWLVASLLTQSQNGTPGAEIHRA